MWRRAFGRLRQRRESPRIGVKRWAVEGRRQQLAVAIDDVGAPERGGGVGSNRAMRGTVMPLGNKVT